MARGREVDQATVQLVLQMKERNEALTTAKIGAVLGMDATTAGRILQTGSWEGYCRWKEEKARKEREKNKRQAEMVKVFDEMNEQFPDMKRAEEQAEEQVPGQMRMELPEAEPQKQAEFDQTKMMRFLAGQFGMIFDLVKVNGEWFTTSMNRQYTTLNEIRMKLDKLNDTMNMIIRCIRKE